MNEEKRETLSKVRSGVAIIVIDQSGNYIYLGKRIGAYKAGFFGLPGGRMDEDSPEKEAERELLEETEIKESLVPCGVVHDYSDGYNSEFIHHIFVCKTNQIPKRVENDKCEGWNKYPLDQLPQPTLPGHQAAIDCFRHWQETNENITITVNPSS